jgi:hypothetical protein
MKGILTTARDVGRRPLAGWAQFWRDAAGQMAGARLLVGERRRGLRDQCILRLDDALQVAADNPNELKALEAQRERLEALNHRP